MLIGAGRALAQSSGSAEEPPVQAPAPAPQSSGPAQPAPGMQSDAELVVTLVRTTMVALHQANLTGNYTVLRDLSAPEFRDRNSATELGAIFAPIRQRGIDLSAVVLLNPNLSRAELTGQKLLHVMGVFATRPVPVAFELLFQPITGTWRLYGISVTPGAAAGAAGPQLAPALAEPAQAGRSAARTANRPPPTRSRPRAKPAPKLPPPAGETRQD
jgi:hypothetical protein